MIIIKWTLTETQLCRFETDLQHIFGTLSIAFKQSNLL